MTTTTMQNRKTNLMPLVLFLLVAVIIMLSMAHAVTRHGTEAAEIKACSEGSDNLLEKWVNPDNGRVYWCVDFFGQFALSIEEGNGDFITAFLKEKLKSLEQVERYLSNGGAEQVW